MNLKKTILAVMSRDELKAAVEAASLKQVDRRSVQSMRDALAKSRRLGPDALLAAMTEAQVKAVCERAGIDQKGRKSALIQRLLASKPRPRREDAPAQPPADDPPAASEPAQRRSPPPATVSVTKTELVWPGKYNEDGTLREAPRVSLPFQVIETVNESRAARDAKAAGTQRTLFDVYRGDEGDTFEDGWRNKLIWGDNLLVMGSLLEKFAGKVDLIYIDPPFDTGDDFSHKVLVGNDDTPMSRKQPSVVEEVAYRDTWGGGYNSYLGMLTDRLQLLRSLLSERGAIFVHLDVHMGPYIKVIMDQLFGQENFRNEIAWYYYNKMHDSRKKLLPRSFDQILYYVKNRHADFTYNSLEERRDSPARQLKREKKDGRMVNARDADGNVIYQERLTRVVDAVWRLRCLQPANKAEWVHYDTQKPVDLLERVLKLASRPGDLVLDAFVGSGSMAVASELQDRRWIACDLGRFAIHTTRKRLLGIENCKPFEVLNLGKYERQYWQGASFAGPTSATITETALYEYLAFILKLYGARPLPGLAHLHGQKNRALVHIGAVDAPVTIGDVDAAIDECVKLRQQELHVLGWEWEMGLNDLMANAAKAKGVKLLLLQIPREVMERQAADKGDVRFFELAYLKATVRTPRKLTAHVELEEFVIPNPELIPDDVRSKVRKWSDYIDYWAVDWDFRHDTFMQGWVTYRTRRDRSLALASDPHTYPKAGKYRALVKVIDIFGNDTSQLFDVRVK